MLPNQPVSFLNIANHSGDEEEEKDGHPESLLVSYEGPSNSNIIITL